MVNEEIVTGLRNAIEHGDSLENAMQIMMNSGYSPAEVQEAAKFFSGGILSTHQPKPEEQLTMPNKKPGLLSKLKQKPFQQPQLSQIQKPIQSTQSQIQTPKQPTQLVQPQIQPPNQVQQPMPALQTQQTTPLTKQLQGIKPKTKSHSKEIMLVILLLVLIGILITTIFFKDTIVGWFS